MRDHHRISDGPFFQPSGRAAGSLFLSCSPPLEAADRKHVRRPGSLKLWSQSPAPRLKLFGVRRCAPSGGVEAMPCGSNASGFVAINTLMATEL